MTEQKYGYRTFHHTNCIHSSREPGDYGSWEESYSTTIEQKVQKVTKYPDVNSSFDFNPGDIAYLITVIYSTGDSFGNSERGSVEDVWLFKNPAIAMDFKNHILSVEKKRSWNTNNKHTDYHYHNDEEGFHFTPQYVHWNGYFEKFEECILTMVLVELDYEEL